MRRVNDEALDLIKRWEGLRLEAYQDTGGVWTIGYGHTATAKPGMRIQHATADSLLKRDLGDAEQAVERAVQVPLTDGQFGALVSFTFNVGAGALRRSTLLKKLNAGDYEAVPAELMKWVKDNGRTVQGLVNRRAAEAGLWARGAFVAGNTVAAAPARSVSPAAAAAGGVGVTAAVGAVLEAAPALSVLQGLDWRVGAVLVVVAAIGAAAWWMRGRG